MDQPGGRLAARTSPSRARTPMPPERPRLPVLRAPTREGRCRRQAPGEPEELCGTAPCLMREEPAPSRGGRRPPLPAVTASSGLSAASFAADLPLPCALPRSAVLGPAPGVLPRGGPQQVRGPLRPRGRAAAPPGGCRGPSHRSLRSHRGFAKFLPATSVVPPHTPNPARLSFLSVGSRREPRGQPAPLPPPACLLAPRPSLPPPVCSAGQRQNCEACRLPDGRGPGLVGPGGRAGRSPALRRLPSRSRRARFGQRERRSRCQRRKGELGREQSCRERGRGST